jgi:hypothetical protein
MNIRFAFFFVPFVLLFSLTSTGQSLQGEYMKVDYLSVASEYEEEFLEQTRTNWKNLQQSRIEEGEISSWKLYKVKFPGSWNTSYNYVSVTSAGSMSAFESSDHRTLAVESSGQSSSSAYRPSQSIVHSELWVVRNSITKSEDFVPSQYFMMDYMDVPLGREYEYQMFEDEIARPLHEDRMEMDRMNAWELYQLIIPGGVKYGYNFATGNFFNNIEHIEFGFTNELIRANHPDVNLMEFFETIFATRDLVRSELSVLVDYLKE